MSASLLGGLGEFISERQNPIFYALLHISAIGNLPYLVIIFTVSRSDGTTPALFLSVALDYIPPMRICLLGMKKSEITAIIKAFMTKRAVRGGQARAKSLTSKRRSEIARAAAKARWDKGSRKHARKQAR
jgi:hypothetical protein